MHKYIKKFGIIVGHYVETAPHRARALLKAAYQVSGWQMRHLPKRDLLPSQQYLAVLCNKAIVGPLDKPERSAVVNLFLPCEILHAMNITPQFTEGLSCYLNGAGSEYAFIEYAEKSGVPKSFCSYHKALLGAVLSGVLPKPRFVLNTTMACDANTDTFRKIAEHYQVPHFTVDVPNYYGPEEEEYVARQLKEMTSFIEDIMGERLNHKKLQQVMQSEDRSLRLYETYLSKLGLKSMPNDPTTEMYKIFCTHILLGTKKAEKYFELLLKDVENAPQSKDEIRLLWVHTIPFWQDSIRNIFNCGDGRYRLIGCDINFDASTVISDPDPYVQMSRRLLLNTFCGSVNKRAEKVIELAKGLNIDGVVYFCHWGCKNTLGGGPYIKNFLKEEGIPLILIDGDGCDRNNTNEGQINTRMQAFLEMLEGAK